MNRRLKMKREADAKAIQADKRKARNAKGHEGHAADRGMARKPDSALADAATARDAAEPDDLGAFLWIGHEPVLRGDLMDSLGAGRLHFLRALFAFAALLRFIGGELTEAG